MRCLALLALLALLATVHAGLIVELNDPRDAPSAMSCCVRTFLRNTGGVDPQFDPSTQYYYEGVDDRSVRGDGGMDGRPFYEHPGVITSGRVTQLDTHCVNSKDDVFRDWFDLKQDLAYVDLIPEQDAPVLCPLIQPPRYIREHAYPDPVAVDRFLERSAVWVKTKYECAVLQSCNNFQFDESTCGHVCSSRCGARYDPSGSSPSYGRPGCYAWCKNFCEHSCVGQCFNDFECVYDCVAEDAEMDKRDVKEEKREELGHKVDGGRTSWYDLPDTLLGSSNLIQEFLYGDIEPSVYSDYIDLNEFDGGYDGSYKREPRKVESQNRPGFNVRTNELEFVMSVYPDVSCNDLEGFCRA
eukprot:TRINITY_DN52_c0_g1_i1.p1 TRINITY_DN52_c0_g1~~TRINITY_DN52_c0_g1_i1.p1  ORF type:complete len:355 (+),score=61.15 TRINITY_DN52_c0_g1_i1:52-1116(+)